MANHIYHTLGSYGVDDGGHVLFIPHRYYSLRQRMLHFCRDYIYYATVEVCDQRITSASRPVIPELVIGMGHWEWDGSIKMIIIEWVISMGYKNDHYRWVIMVIMVIIEWVISMGYIMGLLVNKMVINGFFFATSRPSRIGRWPSRMSSRMSWVHRELTRFSGNINGLWYNF